MTQQEPGGHRMPDAISEHRTHMTRRIGLAGAALAVVAGGTAVGGDMAGLWDLPPYDHHTEQIGSTEAPTGQPQVLPPKFAGAEKQSVLTNTWHMLGATQDTRHTAIKFQDGNWAVRTIDDNGHTTGYDPKPPQLLVGPRLATKGGDFGIAGHLSDVDGAATVRFTNEPDVVLDESVHLAPGIAVREDKNRSVYVDVYNGKKNKPAESHKLTEASGAGTTDFWLYKDGKEVTVGSGKETVTVNEKLFNKQVIFGADGTFTLDNLDVYATGEKPVEIVDTSKRVLPPVAKDGFQGIAASHGRPDLKIVDAVDFSSIDASMPLLENVGSLKPEMLGKMQAIYRGTPDANGNIKQEDFDFTELRALIDLAKRSGRSVDMHTLIWGEAMPKPVEDFMRHAAKTGNRQAALNFVDKYVRIVVGETKDDVDTYDIVNEPMGSTDNDSTAMKPQEHLVFQATGGVQYIETAMTAAAEAGAKRIRVNENGLETWTERRTATLNVVAPIAQKMRHSNIKEVRDAKIIIGVQFHEDASDAEEWVNDDAGGRIDPTYVSDDMNDVVNEIAAKGMDTDITEASVDAEDTDAESAEQVQAAVYAGAANVAMRNKHVHSLGFWGLVSDKRYMTTTYHSDGTYELGNDTPWKMVGGEVHEKKLVVDAIKAGLRGDIHELS